MSVVIVGGGIAGLAAAVNLARSAEQSVLVLEREPGPFRHSSSKNAGIFRPLELQPALVELARRSRELLSKMGPELVSSNGLCLIARHAASMEPLTAVAKRMSVQHAVLSGDALAERAPLLRGGRAHVGLFLNDGGIIDLPALRDLLTDAAKQSGAVLQTGAVVTSIEVRGGRVAGVVLADGQRLEADVVVNAAGAWAADLGRSCGSAVSLHSHRRHLAQLAPDFSVDAGHPVCWDIDTEVYFRPSGSGVMACPGDDTEHEPRVPDVDQQQLDRLYQLLPEHAPRLANARQERAWACLRTRTHDGSMAIGDDPNVAGLYWLAGLGGHGMTVGLAAGELLATLITGGSHPLAGAFSVQRLSS